MNINIIIIITINNRLFSTHTHVGEFMTSKTSWHIKKKWHAMTSIGAINSRHTKTYGVTNRVAMKICDTLLPNGMPCHYHMEN